MSEQQEYYTFTKDVKTLVQYVQEQAFDHLVIEAAERLNKAIKKDLKGYGIPVTPAKESKDSFEEEKQQYAEDSRTYEKPWELWQSALAISIVLNWRDLYKDPDWAEHWVYRRKPTAFMPEYYSGLNCKDAEHLIGKVVEGTNYPNEDWKTVKLINITNGKHRSGVFEVYHQKEPGVIGTYEYIRTVEEILVPEHPTINICGVELPIPETVAPALGIECWLAPACNKFVWRGYKYNIENLQAGRVHLTEERAKAWADWWKKKVIAKINEIGS